ncbi:MAG: hypothetical protein ABSA45_04125, partial [Verrucomicrobiota bacterium]
NTIPAEGNPSSPIAFRAKLQVAREWSDYYGRPVHVGEFGAYTMADPVSRANFYMAFRSTLDSLGIGWAMWDWNAGFHYWDPNTGQPAPGMRSAMFPAPQLIATGPGQIQFAGAVAKTFVVERALSLTSTSNWVGIQTQILTSPKFNFTDTIDAQTNAAFYRAKWLK